MSIKQQLTEDMDFADVYTLQDNSLELSLSAKDKRQFIDCINSFTENNVQKLFIAHNAIIYMYFHLLNKQHIITFIQSIKNDIPNIIYLLMLLLLNTDINLLDCIKKLNVKDIPLLIYRRQSQEVLIKYNDVIVKHLYNISFNESEKQIINKYLNTSLPWNIMRLSNEITLFDLRCKIINTLFLSMCKNYTYVENDTSRMQALKQYFTDELLSYDQSQWYLVYGCCYHRLLDKEFIDKVYMTNEECFGYLVRYTRQYEDYIRSLLLINKLSKEGA